MHDHANCQTEEAVKAAHPLRVALGQIVVDRDHMRAAAAQRIQIYRQGGYQRFAFAGFHFRNLAIVQHHAADQLDVEVTHVEHAPAGLAHHGKGLDQDLAQHFLDGVMLLLGKTFYLINIVFLFGRGSGIIAGTSACVAVQTAQTLLNALAKFSGLRAQLSVGQLLDLRLERIDRLDVRHQRLNDTLVLGPENLA